MCVKMEMRKLSEEAHCLRELLARNREELERERRLNEAIKQKKVSMACIVHAIFNILNTNRRRFDFIMITVRLLLCQLSKLKVG